MKPVRLPRPAERVESAIGFLLAGVQALVESGVDPQNAFATGEIELPGAPKK